MSATLELISEKLPELSVKELLQLQEKLTAQLKNQLEPAQTEPQGEQLLLHLIPGAYRPTPEEIEAELRALFGDEYDEIEERAKTFDPSTLPPLPRRIVEYIDEDREDRPLPKITREAR
jgi:hypothetical protein